MSHIIEAIVLKGGINKEVAQEFELIEVKLDFDLHLFFIDDDFTAYWEKKLNVSGYLETNCKHTNKLAIYELMRRISINENIEYAIISTAYVGGFGDQFANIYKNDRNVDLTVDTINKALKYLGVVKSAEEDEFDAVGLGRFRRNPDYLLKYKQLLKDLS